MYDEFQTQQFWNNMRKSQIKQLIKEEFNKILNEENELSFEDIKFIVREKLNSDYDIDIDISEIDSMNELVGTVALYTDPTGYRMNKDKAKKEAEELIQKYIQ
jgi:hypothetical protein